MIRRNRLVPRPRGFQFRIESRGLRPFTGNFVSRRKRFRYPLPPGIKVAWYVAGRIIGHNFSRPSLLNPSAFRCFFIPACYFTFSLRDSRVEVQGRRCLHQNGNREEIERRMKERKRKRERQGGRKEGRKIGRKKKRF